ncbi:PaaI family thioesterase [Desulfocurvus vexinensis]|uniref:PaaI family thioesterase n=1 Tax=Desulfocurvus vexinensis TaxID=399548 RepID=UPI0004B18F42|nr:PaaI family thioesterase [Desulfocurvus vexinensis]
MRSYLDALQQPGQTVNPLFATLGVEVEHVTDGEATLRLPPNAGLVQGGGVVAGGVLATLADEAMAHAVIGGLAEGLITATVECSVRFLSPARPGAALRARAVVVRRGRTIVFAEASVTDSDGRLLARASGSFLVMPRRPGPEAAAPDTP